MHAAPFASAWTQALSLLQSRVGPETFDLSIRPICLVEEREGTVSLAAPSRFIKEWFETHYLEALADALEETVGRRLEVQVEVRDLQNRAELVDDAHVDTDASHDGDDGGDLKTSGPEPSARPPGPVRVPRGILDRYRFENFVLGASNELAASAAKAAAENPGQRFNPLFIYGGVGLGKTHLLHAVGNDLHDRDPSLRIAYISAEQFMNEFVTAVRNNDFDGFRARYRNDCDCLLVDDIQFIAGRDRTMDEFFHVFNALYEAGKQIVVTADCVPAQMKGMEERLTSRLNWGLVADIQAPDLETRLAILYERAARDDMELPQDVAMEIAKSVKSNVRELEGALLRVTAFADLRHRTLDAAFVREVLQIRPEPSRAVTVESIQKAVAHYFSIKVSDLKGSRRMRAISRPRMVAMFLSRELTGSSFPEIGMRFGGKDHSTVINACRRIQQLREEDTDVQQALEALRARLDA